MAPPPGLANRACTNRAEPSTDRLRYPRFSNLFCGKPGIIIVCGVPGIRGYPRYCQGLLQSRSHLRTKGAVSIRSYNDIDNQHGKNIQKPVVHLPLSRVRVTFSFFPQHPALRGIAEKTNSAYGANSVHRRGGAIVSWHHSGGRRVLT